jgi:FkbM family methyltransferase
MEEGTEKDNPFPVFVELVRRLALRSDVQVFSLHGEERVRALSLASLRGEGMRPHRFAGADVFQLGTARARRGRIALDVARLLATIRRLSPDLRPQVLHGIGQSPGIVATLAGRLLGVPSIVSLVGGELTSLPSIGYGERRTLRSKAFMEVPLRWANALTAPSRFMQMRIEALGARAARMPFGIDTGRFSGPVVRPPGPPFRLLHVGTLCPVKDQVTLVRAVGHLAASGLDVELDIVGSDEWGGRVHREAARLSVANRVRIHGWKNHDELHALYRMAHVFVMTSRDDVAPVAVLEAAASGLPIAGTDVGFIADWAPEAAVATPADDPTALARALKELLLDAGRRDALASRAQAWVRTYASLEANDAFVRLYESLLEGRKVSRGQAAATVRAALRRLDDLPGAQTVRTLAGLDSWHDRRTFARWVVERRLGIPYHEPPVEAAAVITRYGFRFEPRPGAADRNVLGPFHEVQTRSFVRRNFARGAPRGVFVDVGAHCGSFSIPLSPRFDTVIALEPLPDNYRALRRNVELNELHQKVRCLPFAAGAASAAGALFLGSDETSSIVPAPHSTDTVRVEVRTLDDLLADAGARPSDVRLLKVDVEGAELFVLSGAARLFAEGSPVVVLEANTAAARSSLASYMERLGYELVRIADGRNMCFRRFA